MNPALRLGFSLIVVSSVAGGVFPSVRGDWFLSSSVGVNRPAPEPSLKDSRKYIEDGHGYP